MNKPARAKPGRPPKAAKDRHSVAVTIRLTPGEWARVRRAAAAAGLPARAWLCQAALERLKAEG